LSRYSFQLFPIFSNQRQVFQLEEDQTEDRRMGFRKLQAIDIYTSMLLKILFFLEITFSNALLISVSTACWKG